jgi:hypothetical protein
VRRAPRRGRVHQHSLTIISTQGARDALIQLNQGGATLVKTFQEFFDAHGHRDSLFADDSQTARKDQTMEQSV